YRSDYAAMIESFSKLDRGASVLIGSSGTGEDPPFHDLTEYPMYYAPTLAIAYANAFVPNLFTAVGKQPVQARPNVAHLAITHGGPGPVTVLSGTAAGAPGLEIPSFIRSWTHDYDYLYPLVGALPIQCRSSLKSLSVPGASSSIKYAAPARGGPVCPMTGTCTFGSRLQNSVGPSTIFARDEKLAISRASPAKLGGKPCAF